MEGEGGLPAIPAARVRFEELEQIIGRGLGTFVEVGRALLEIQQRRLYREVGHRTFAEYVAERWDLSKAHAYRHIEASKVVDILSPIGDIPLPTSEAQARELAPLVSDPEAVRTVWTETIAQGAGRVTARAIRERVAARKPRTGPNLALREQAPDSAARTKCPACGHEWSD